MEISGLVNYEQLFPLKLLNPSTEAELGITFQIRSAESEAAKAVLRKHTDKNLERRVKNKLPKADQVIQEELEKAASYIASWDWGVDPKSGTPNTYQGSVPVLSMKTAIQILEEQGWIFAAVTEAANKIGNFTPTSPKPSVDTSV